MRLHVLSTSLLMACAGGATRSGAPAAPAAEGPPALRAGPHELVLSDVRLFYRVGGAAPAGTPPVVFLHGGPGQGSAHFDALAGPFMERELLMVYLDQRASGASEQPASGDYALATLVEDIEALRQALGVPQLALIGHSFGSVLGLEYAAKYPEHVSHLIVVAGLWDTQVQCRLRLQRFAELRPEAYERARGDTIRPDGTRRNECDIELRARNALPGPDRQRFNMETMFPDPAVAARIDSVNTARNVRHGGELSRALLTAGGNRYRFAAFGRLTMPVLVVAGRFDGAAISAGLRDLARSLPRARFVEFERSGHFVYLDEPDRFVREVAAFLRTR
jgi:proline iminopeptidase